MTAVRTDLGRRVELVSMDPRHGDITIGLYVRDDDRGPVGKVYSYSRRAGTAERLETIAATMCALGGLEPAGQGGVRFTCGAWHNAAAKRLFVEACRHDPATPARPGALSVTDSRSGQEVVVVAGERGAYRVLAEGATEEVPSRAPAIARAIAKLAELDLAEADETLVTFPCGHRHDALVGLLLGRAQNLRQLLREEELNSSRGVLAAPSAQE